MKTPLSPLLSAFVAARNTHDTDAFVACFAPDGVVHDEGRDHRGTPAIAAWFGEVSRKYQMSLEVTSVSGRGEDITLTGLMSGDFDGSPIQLRYRMILMDGKITALTITP